MSKQIITQKASDNPYFHKDFHIAFNYGIEYIHKKFGEEAVREYLIQFARALYIPLMKAIGEEGLVAVKDHYERIYKIEGADFDMKYSKDELIIRLSSSPAVMYIKSKGYVVSQLFNETVDTVNKTICENSRYAFEMSEYKEENGAYVLRFYKKQR
jgi:hypothetical protein